MFYTMYLDGVCSRRQWPAPHYEFTEGRTGYQCKVRVNNREYNTEVPFENQRLAMENAAMQAYMICRNFSANDGMYPGHRPGQRTSKGTVQGLPVAIGAGRKPHRDSVASFDAGSSEGTASGSSSPKAFDGGFGYQLHQPQSHVPAGAYHGNYRPMQVQSCPCGQAPVGRCALRCHERVWA